MNGLHSRGKPETIAPTDFPDQQTPTQDQPKEAPEKKGEKKPGTPK